MDSICYLMRGLPSTGKTHTARRLAGDTGTVCETDEFFYTEVGTDPAVYDFDLDLMSEARAWNFDRFRAAVDKGVSPIVVDRGNGLTLESRRYAVYAQERGYKVELAEPDSSWWAEIRVLLKYRQHTLPVLRAWAKRLAEMSMKTHGVPPEEIWSRMQNWRHGLCIEDILNLDESARSLSTEPAADSAAVGTEASSATISPAAQVELSIPATSPQTFSRKRPSSESWLHDVLVAEDKTDTNVKPAD